MRSRFGLGTLAGLAVMAVAALAYGALLRATMSAGGAYHEFTFAALAVGLAVGAATGLAGGRNAALPVVGLLLAMVGVFLGEIVGLALISAYRNGTPVTDVVIRHYGTLFGDWRRQVDVMSCVFLFLAGVEGFIVTRRFGDRRLGDRG